MVEVGRNGINFAVQKMHTHYRKRSFGYAQDDRRRKRVLIGYAQDDRRRKRTLIWKTTRLCRWMLIFYDKYPKNV